MTNSEYSRKKAIELNPVPADFTEDVSEENISKILSPNVFSQWFASFPSNEKIGQSYKPNLNATSKKSLSLIHLLYKFYIVYILDTVTTTLSSCLLLLNLRTKV